MLELAVKSDNVYRLLSGKTPQWPRARPGDVYIVVGLTEGVVRMSFESLFSSGLLLSQ